MSGTEQQESVRRVWTQAGYIINDEINRLNRELEDKDNLLKIKDKQLVQSLFDYAVATQRKKQDGLVLDYTIIFAVVGWILALGFIGYAVWVG